MAADVRGEAHTPRQSGASVGVEIPARHPHEDEESHSDGRVEAYFEHLADELQHAVNGLQQETQRLAASREELELIRIQRRGSSVLEHLQAEAHGLQKTLEVGVVLWRIFNVSTIDETFDASVSVMMRWECPPHEKPPRHDEEWVPNWVPQYRFNNLLRERVNQVRYEQTEIDDILYVAMEASHTCTFFQSLNLRKFPADCQELLISFESEFPERKVKWMPMEIRDDSAAWLDASKCTFGEFELLRLRDMPGWTYTFSNSFLSHLQAEASSMQIRVKVRRDPSHFLMNILGVMLVVVSLSFLAWGCHPGDLIGRHHVDMSLILSAVAFKLVLSSHLPVLNYNSMLDNYLLLSLTSLILMCIFHTFLPWIYGLDQQNSSPLTKLPASFDLEQEVVDADKTSLWLAIGVWVSLNAIYVVHFVHVQQAELRSFTQKAREEMKTTDARKASVSEVETPAILDDCTKADSSDIAQEIGEGAGPTQSKSTPASSETRSCR